MLRVRIIALACCLIGWPSFAQNLNKPVEVTRPVNMEGVWQINDHALAPLCGFTQSDSTIQGICVGPNAAGLAFGIVSGDEVQWTWTWKGAADGQQHVSEFKGSITTPILAIQPAKISGTIDGFGSFAAEKIRVEPTHGPRRLLTSQPPCFPVAGAQMISPRPIAETHIVNPLDYPSLSVLRGESGTVKLKVLVSEDGTVINAQITESSGMPRLDLAAIGFIRDDWRYTPGTVGGCPAKIFMPVQVSWVNSRAVPKPDSVPDMSDFASTIGTPDAKGYTRASIIGKLSKIDFPIVSLRRGNYGDVVLGVLVDERGKVVEEIILWTTGYARLDYAALAAALDHAGYSPGQLDGRPVKSWVTLWVKFRRT